LLQKQRLERNRRLKNNLVNVLPNALLDFADVADSEESDGRNVRTGTVVYEYAPADATHDVSLSNNRNIIGRAASGADNRQLKLNTHTHTHTETERERERERQRHRAGAPATYWHCVSVHGRTT